MKAGARKKVVDEGTSQVDYVVDTNTTESSKKRLDRLMIWEGGFDKLIFRSRHVYRPSGPCNFLISLCPCVTEKVVW